MFGGRFGGEIGRGRALMADSVRFPMLAEVRGYWEALRGGGLPPLRSDLDPRGMASALENSFVVERVAPGIARFRIAGMQICDLMGMDVRGMPFLSLIDPPARSDFGTALERVFSGPSILEMALEAERGIGRPALEARLLMLPLRNRAGVMSLALGCLATDGLIGRSPRRFAIARKTVTPLVTSAAGTEAPALTAGLAEAPAPFVPRPVPGHPYLRLVKG